MITLYCDGYFVNQWDATCFCALEEKGLPYSAARAMLRDGGGVPSALTGRTSIARVPALQHGDFWLSESSAIIEYLEETFPPPTYARLLPADPHARARVRQVMAFIRSDLWALRTEREWWRCVYPAEIVPALSREAERDAHELVDLVVRLAGTGEFAVWNISHVDLVLSLLRLACNDYPIPEPAQQLIDTVRARPSVRAYLERQRPPNPPPRALASG